MSGVTFAGEVTMRALALYTLILLGGTSAAPAQTSRTRAPTPPVPPSQGPPAHAPPGWAAFTALLDRTAAQDSVVGWTAVFVAGGRVTARHVRGQADRSPPRPVDERTIFHYGSITKTLTAVAVMQLRDRGRLSLDDPVTRYVPELRQVVNPTGTMDDVTIRMLLSHSSGLQNPTWPWRRYERWEPFEPTRWEQLVAMMPYQRLLFRPGSRYGYSNPAFIYLARIVELVSGDPWQSYVYKNVWLPLGITSSYFAATPWHLAGQRSNNFTLVRDSAGLRVVANGLDFDPGITIPNGGWNAPVGDLVTWAAFLTGAAVGVGDVLSRASLEEMWRPVVTVDSGEQMGLSFFIRQVRGGRVVGHTGYQAGFRSFLYFNPATGQAVIGVVNSDNEAASRESQAAWGELLVAATELLVGR